eukprot:NODE_27_length_39007_cov_1.590650.p4 type:complete len:657 gc:universal NODE_27_length_39007_cov_1.590650:20211-18241(-)
MSDSDSDFVQEEKDFSLVHALQTFKATVDSQIDVIKNEPLLLLDDSNNYWWLVKPLSSNQIGYIPAEIVETPSERLARVNRHRNLQLSEFKEQEDYVGKLGATDKSVRFSESVIDNNGNLDTLASVDKRVSSVAGKFLKRPDSGFDVDSSEEDTEELSDELVDEEVEQEEVLEKEADINENEKHKIINKEQHSEESKPKQATVTLAKLEGKVRPSPVKNFPKSTKVTAIRIYQGKMSNSQEIAQFKTVAATEATTVGELLRQAALKFRVFGKLRKSGLDVDKRSSIDIFLNSWFLSIKSKSGERKLANEELILQVLNDLNVKMDRRRSLFSKSNDQVEVSTLQEEIKVFLHEITEGANSQRSIEFEESNTSKNEAKYKRPLPQRPMSSAELSANIDATMNPRPMSSFESPISNKMGPSKRMTIGVEQPSKRDTFSQSVDKWILAKMILNTEKKITKTVKVPVSVKFGDLVQSTIRKIANKNGLKNIAFDMAFLDGEKSQIVVTDSIRDALKKVEVDVDTRDPKIPILVHVMVRIVADPSVATQITKKRATITSDMPLNQLIDKYGIETVDKPKISLMDHIEIPTDRSPSNPPSRALPTPGKSDRKPIHAHELINTSNLSNYTSSGDSLLAIAEGIKGVSSFEDFINAISSSETEFD